MDSNNLSFVYVEDDATSREVMDMLIRHGIDCDNLTIFEDSDNFIKRIEQIEPKPNFFLLDIHVAPYTGIEMLQMLRQHKDFKDARVVAVTASVMNEEVNTLKNSGFDGGIAKPIQMEVFPNLIERLVKGEVVWYVT